MYKKISMLFLVSMLICVCIPTKAFANSANVKQFAEENNVSTSKIWVINCSKEISSDDITSVIVESNKEVFPTNIKVSGKQITVTPVNIYKENTKYVLSVNITNGKKHSMSFATTGIIRQPNDTVFEVQNTIPEGSNNSTAFNKEFNITNISEQGQSLVIEVNSDTNNPDEAYQLSLLVKQSITNLNNRQIQNEMATNIKSVMIVVKGSTKNWMYDGSTNIYEIK